MTTNIKRIFVRRYSDSGQITAYCEFGDASGRTVSRTESTLRRFDISRRRPAFTFGTHMHALAARAKREGVKLQLETW